MRLTNTFGKKTRKPPHDSWHASSKRRKCWASIPPQATQAVFPPPVNSVSPIPPISWSIALPGMKFKSSPLSMARDDGRRALAKAGKTSVHS